MFTRSKLLVMHTWLFQERRPEMAIRYFYHRTNYSQDLYIYLFLVNLQHPNEIANMSLALLECKQQVRVPRTSAELQLRIGIHTGSILISFVFERIVIECEAW